MPAELFGKRLNCVCGDEVMIRGPSQSSGDVAKVVSVSPRRSLFARTDSRGRTEPLAANLSLLIVIIAPEPEPDLYIADRYLAGAALAGISGALIVNKSELPGAEDPDFQERVHDYERAGYPCPTSVGKHDEQSVDLVRNLLADASAMLVGQSGVGKSTLTNRLAPESERATRSLVRLHRRRSSHDRVDGIVSPGEWRRTGRFARRSRLRAAAGRRCNDPGRLAGNAQARAGMSLQQLPAHLASPAAPS